jgi:hypothetical protein
LIPTVLLPLICEHASMVIPNGIWERLLISSHLTIAGCSISL